MDISSRFEERCEANDEAVDGRGDPLLRTYPLFSQLDEVFEELSTVTDGYISGQIWDVDEIGVPMKMQRWRISDLKVLIAAMTHGMETECSRWSKKARVKRIPSKNAVVKSRLQGIADFMLMAGVTDPIRDEASCGRMWRILAQDWKAIYDYDGMRYYSSKSYYEMTPEERRHNPLFPTPGKFPRELYDDMMAFYNRILGADAPEQRLVLLKRWVKNELLLGREDEREAPILED